MAQTTTYAGNGAQTNLPTIVQQLVGRVRTHLERRQKRDRLRSELNQYSVRELSDMGLCRDDIDGIVARAHHG